MKNVPLVLQTTTVAVYSEEDGNRFLNQLRKGGARVMPVREEISASVR